VSEKHSAADPHKNLKDFQEQFSLKNRRKQARQGGLSYSDDTFNGYVHDRASPTMEFG
jgi:hypothetical protein